MTATTRRLEPVKARRISPFGWWLAFLALLIVVGAASGLYVLIYGLGVTALTDNVPWGLWITVDLTTIALGAGAFSLSAIAYIFRVHSFRKIARMAVFVGLTGYTSAMLALFMDIGRPDRFWHPTVYWNIHSVLWEITMCVFLYATVLIVEFLPVLLESEFARKRWPRGVKLAHTLHRLTPFVAVLGLGLSLLHQSSLGATYGVLVARPVWFKPSMPVMFILSAVGAGATVTLGITILYENFKRQRVLSATLRRQVAMFAGLTMLAYLYLKLWDYLATSYYSHLPARTEATAVLEGATPYGTTFWFVEILIGALIPAIILLWPRLRRQDTWLLGAMGMAILGTLINRWNVTLSGLILPLDWSPGVAELFPINPYQPALSEWGVALGIAGYALTVLTLGLRYLPLFPENGDDGHDHK